VSDARTLERGGARIAYRVTGDGPPVLLGHSLLCDGRMWDGVIARLGGRFRIYNIDVRGHGASTAPAPFTLEDLADDWRALLDQEKIPRAILCGLSMGGMTAMRLALASPERVAGMALLDSSADPQPAWERFKFRLMVEALVRVGHHRLLDRAVAPLMFGPDSLRDRREVVDAQLARIRENAPAQIYHGVRAVIERRSIHDRLPSLRCPVRVIVGADDRATPPERSRRIAAAIPGARLSLVPRAGHLSAVERPDEIARQLAEFFSSIPV
jgi:pimeloyl-ACP methyl ester carboxylesterase